MIKKYIVCAGCLVFITLCGCAKVTENECVSSLYYSDTEITSFESVDNTVISDEVSTYKLQTVSVTYPTGKFSIPVISDTENGITTMTAHGDSGVNVLYISELIQDDVISGYADYILDTYDDLILERYQVDEYTLYESKGISYRKYLISLSDESVHYAFTYSSGAITYYIEIVASSDEEVDTAFSYIEYQN